MLHRDKKGARVNTVLLSPCWKSLSCRGASGLWPCEQADTPEKEPPLPYQLPTTPILGKEVTQPATASVGDLSCQECLIGLSRQEIAAPHSQGHHLHPNSPLPTLSCRPPHRHCQGSVAALQQAGHE